MAAAVSVWSAPSCAGPLNASVTLPGSKSQTNRALMLGATAAEPLPISGALSSRDTVLAAQALQQLGVRFSTGEDGELEVHGRGSPQLNGEIDCGLAGTVMRFVPALATFGEGSVRFDGDAAARTRPLADLLDALEALGARIDYHGEHGKLPFTLTGRGTSGAGVPNSVDLDSSATSQYLSALLLAGPAAPISFEVRVTGTVPSAAHVEMTEKMLIDQGVPVSRTSENTFLVSNQVPAGEPIVIEPDLSNAGPFLAAALICGGTVRLEGWPAETQQAGADWLNILPRFGARVHTSGTALVVEATGERWNGLDIDLTRVGELTPTVAALCTLATGPSTITGIAHLRGHETDRLKALVTEIRRCGGRAEELEDGLRIEPGELRPADFNAYADHRMATFGALLGLAIPGCTVDDIECTDKTLPQFPQRWDALLTGGPAPAVPALADSLNLGEAVE